MMARQNNELANELCSILLESVKISDHELGRGAFGIVFKAELEYDGTTYAAQQIQSTLMNPTMAAQYGQIIQDVSL